jgi:hypothetical protein
MTWNVENTDEFTEWWHELTDAQQEDITATGRTIDGARSEFAVPAFL